jgi:hypothetical protein
VRCSAGLHSHDLHKKSLPCRLICVSTVEENILKKANQKRMLGDLAIEGGAFTTEFFKQVLLGYHTGSLIHIHTL